MFLRFRVDTWLAMTETAPFSVMVGNQPYIQLQMATSAFGIGAQWDAATSTASLSLGGSGLRDIDG